MRNSDLKRLGSSDFGKAALLRIGALRAQAGALALALAIALSSVGIAGQPAFAKSTETVDRSDADQAEITSVLGGYLAGRVAQGQRDIASAAAFFRDALDRAPDDELLLKQSFLMEAQIGNVERATELAEKVILIDSSDRLARLLLGAVAFQNKDYTKAEMHFQAAGADAISELTATLARAWVKTAQGQATEALDLLERLQQAQLARIYRRYHRALIADYAGKTDIAEQAYGNALDGNTAGLRFLLAYAHHAAAKGDLALARKTAARSLRGGGEPHPLARDLLVRLRSGEKVGLMIATPTQGLAEVFYGLGEALSSEGVVDIGSVYIQISLYLQPDAPLALAALAAAAEQARRFGDANTIYARISDQASVAFTVRLRQALNLERDSKPDEAVAVLQSLEAALLAENSAAANAASPAARSLDLQRTQQLLSELGYYSGTVDGRPGPVSLKAVTEFQRDLGLEPDGIVGTETGEALLLAAVADNDLLARQRLIQVRVALGNLYRGREQFDAAVEAYTKAIDLIGRPQKRHWTYFYSRGAAFERLKQWSKAEIDLKQALQLDAAQPSVLNYLGYSWVDQNLNLTEAVAMIRRAVDLRPDDGYIVDSLGWAYFRLGRFDEATKQLERAVVLKPDDPTINDHLGDAYLQVGRKREAKFQWDYALSLKPSEEDARRINEKIKTWQTEVNSQTLETQQQAAGNPVPPVQ